jgi:hypothetical protein
MVGIGAQVVWVEEEANSVVVLLVRVEYELLVLVDTAVVMDRDETECVDVPLVPPMLLELLELDNNDVFDGDELVVDEVLDEADVDEVVSRFVIIGITDNVVVEIDTVLLGLLVPETVVNGLAEVRDEEAE